MGLVVGATIGRTGHALSDVNGPLLAPGLGAQGATPADLLEVFGKNLRNVLPSYSREVLSAGPSVVELQAAAQRAIDDCRVALG
jgi:orotidine-5'-phosphate decarboxylase